MSRRIQDAGRRAARTRLKTRWPLEDMLGADLVAAALRRIEALPGAARGRRRGGRRAVAQGRQLLAAAGAGLPGRAAGRRIRRATLVELRLSPAGAARAPRPGLVGPGHEHRDRDELGNASRCASAARPRALTRARRGASATAANSGSSASACATRPSSASCCRWPARRNSSTPATFVRSDSRPEYYDFDLFQTTEPTRALDERRLGDLSYTVFDTETTGLDPSEGDEIIQIGAARIVNGKLLRQECFEQLVDPQRGIPAASHPDPRHRAGDGAGPADDRPRCCRRSTPSRRTPCWWRTTPPSTCVSCS